MKLQVSGQTILFPGNQLERGNKPFNIQQGRYIGKPQNINTACCQFESLSRYGIQWVRIIMIAIRLFE